MDRKGPFTHTVSVPVSVTVTVKFTLTDIMGSKHNLSVKGSVTIRTMEFFLNEAELSLNSVNLANSGNLINH